jgi:hypothetical protein
LGVKRNKTLSGLGLELSHADLGRMTGLSLLHVLGGKLVDISIKVFVACRKVTI